MGKNDTAWEGLFEKYRILDKIEREGQYIITADEIRKFREPRLMTKFDHKINLPAIFQNNGLSILPIKEASILYLPFQPMSHLKNLHKKFIGFQFRIISKA